MSVRSDTYRLDDPVMDLAPILESDELPTPLDYSGSPTPIHEAPKSWFGSELPHRRLWDWNDDGGNLNRGGQSSKQLVTSLENTSSGIAHHVLRQNVTVPSGIHGENWVRTRDV